MSSAATVGKAARERAVVELRELGPALKELAHAHGLTISEALRVAVRALLETSVAEPVSSAPYQSVDTEEGTVRISMRLRRSAATRLTTRAAACGLSHGVYIAKLLAEEPPPPLEVTTALGTSTEQLAVVSTDLNELIRAIRRDGTTSEALVQSWLRPLLEEVHRHVGLASRLVAALRSPCTSRGARRNDTVAGQEARS